MSVGAPPRYEARLVNDLLRELTWRTVAARPMGGTEHINVRKLRAALRHALHEARGPSALRVLSVLDSRVSIGALGKGRSASRQLNGELRAMSTDILARDLCFGFFFGPTQTSRRLPRPARPASSHAQSLRHRLRIAATATSLFFLPARRLAQRCRGHSGGRECGARRASAPARAVPRPHGAGFGCRPASSCAQSLRRRFCSRASPETKNEHSSHAIFIGLWSVSASDRRFGRPFQYWRISNRV